MNRSLIMCYLSGSDRNCLGDIVGCDDTAVLCKTIDTLNNEFSNNERVFDIGAAGTAMRFLTALLTIVDGHHIITGSARMRERPIGVLVDALRTLGADIEYAEKEGFPPLIIKGHPLDGGSLSMAGCVSSQYVSALLLIAPYLTHGLKLSLTGHIASRPYIDMTLELMHRWNADAKWIDDKTIEVAHGCYSTKGNVRVERDWSAATFWYEIVAISGTEGAICTSATVDANDLMLSGSLQGDSKAAEVFARLGVHTEMTAKGMRISSGGKVTPRLDADFGTIPDMAQAAVVTCCMLGVPFRISGLESLRIKETDRISALLNELRKLGFVLKAEGDNALLWDGGRCNAESNPIIKTYKDHRMAMAFAPAALMMGSITIDDPAVVSKSYPTFWTDLQEAGFDVIEK